jgi:SH3-like domain-containing protein
MTQTPLSRGDCLQKLVRQLGRLPAFLALVLTLLAASTAGDTRAQSVAPGANGPGASGPNSTGTNAGAPGGSGQPVPRFVSLKADRVNLRSGPSTDYPTSWIFRRAGLPLEVLREVEAWRQVRDAEGTTGWVLQTMLSGRRTVLIMPWDLKLGEQPPEIELRQSAADASPAIAKVEAGVIGGVRSCDKRWCQITVGDFKGYIEQKKLWGVYDGEIVK